MKHRFPIRLLIADERPAEAAALVAALRRVRYRVSPKLARDLEGLEEALAGGQWDLLLISGTLPGASLAACFATAGKARGDVPLVVLDDASSERRTVMLEALRLGARDVVDRTDGEMLQYTVQREIEALEHRRSLGRYRGARAATFETMRWLVDAAREPLAVIHRTDIHFANARFLDLFGIEPSELPVRGGLLACVTPGEREALRAFVDEISEDEDRPVDVELEALHRDGHTFALQVELGTMTLDGRRLHRMLVPEDTAPALTRAAPASAEPAASVVAEATMVEPPPAERPALALIEGGAGPAAPAEPPRAAPPRAEPPGAEPAQAADAPEPAAEADTVRPDTAGERAALLGVVEGARTRSLPEGALHCLLYTEIDNHEALRRLLGEESLDDLVSAVRARIADALPGGAAVARVADDGFAALLSGVTRERALAAHEAVERAVGGALIELDAKTVLVSGSAGIARVKPDDPNATAPLERAFRACQSEIRVAPGILEAAEPPEAEADDEDDDALAGMAEDLAAAMNENRLWLVYQPIVGLHGDPIELYETFLRFRARDGQMVPPPTFLAAAEKAGMLPDVDLWLVNRAIDTLGEQQRMGKRTHLQVKLTHPSVQDVRIPITIGRRVKAERVAPGRLILETSETIATSQVKATRALMHAARGFDCATALEHFGVCRRPFKLLEHLPVDYLTIDSSLVNALADNPASLRRTSRIVERARSLGKRTVAEYVEDPQSIAMLYDTGIDFVQGNYIQPATESLDFEFSMMVG